MASLSRLGWLTERMSCSYIACVEAFAKHGSPPSLFEEHFLDDLSNLSQDLVDVRIMVAKALLYICAKGEWMNV